MTRWLILGLLTAGICTAQQTIQMTPQSVISGRITNQDDEPIPDADVTLMHWVYWNGVRQLRPVSENGEPYGEARTNADGEFALGNLAAGGYYLRAEGRDTWPVFYPGVADPAQATPLQLTGGAQVRGVDLHIPRTPIHHVAGKVIDPESTEPASFIGLTLTPKDLVAYGGPIFDGTYSNGAFQFDRVPPGVYTLHATLPNFRASEESFEPLAHAKQLVTVSDADVEGVTIQLHHTFRITGQISGQVLKDPPEPDPAWTVGVYLISIDGESFPRTAKAKQDGSFMFSGVSTALYRVSVITPPGNYVKSVHFNGLDVTHKPLDLTSSTGGKLDVVMSPNPAEISGTVHGISPEYGGVGVTLWDPGVPPEFAVDFIWSTPIDARDQFQLSDLPPGEYRVIAWESGALQQIDPQISSTPEFRAKFEDLATTVRVAENEHAKIDVVLIPHARIEAEAAKFR